MKHHALRMYDYHVWANEQVFNRLKELPEDTASREVQSVFPSIADALAHVYVVDNIWLRTMRR